MRQTQRLCLVPPNVITFWSQILILIQLSCSHFKLVPTAKRKVEKQKFRMWNNSHCSSFFFQLIMSQFRILLFIERGRWYPSTCVNRKPLIDLLSHFEPKSETVLKKHQQKTNVCQSRILLHAGESRTNCKKCGESCLKPQAAARSWVLCDHEQEDIPCQDTVRVLKRQYPR